MLLGKAWCFYEGSTPENEVMRHNNNKDGSWIHETMVMTLGFYGLGYERVSREAGSSVCTFYIVLFGSVTGSSVSTMATALGFLDLVYPGGRDSCGSVICACVSKSGSLDPLFNVRRLECSRAKAKPAGASAGRCASQHRQEAGAGHSTTISCQQQRASIYEK